MPLLHARFTVRSLLIAMIVVAVWMTMVGSIERTNHRDWISSLGRQEDWYRKAYVEAVRLNQAWSIKEYARSAEECADAMAFHRSQLAGRFPRSFSEGSAVLTLFYAWAVALFVVVRAERRGRDRATGPAPGVRPHAFLAWIGLGFLAPVTVMALGMVFERRTPYFYSGATMPWAASAISALFWLQVVHALLGVLLLRGRRWAALGLGVFSVLVAGWIALHGEMAVTGAWL